jgi:hypothetical protein
MKFESFATVVHAERLITEARACYRYHGLARLRELEGVKAYPVIFAELS